jgi:hypothetical protein
MGGAVGFWSLVTGLTDSLVRKVDLFHLLLRFPPQFRFLGESIRMPDLRQPAVGGFYFGH